MNWLNASDSHLAGYVRRHARPICITAGTVAAGAAVYNHNKQRIAAFRPRLSNTVIEAISGAVGEVAQIVLLYPLDTIKVRCQASSISATAAVQDIARRSGGSALLAVQLLYAGALPAAVTSILVGSVHYVCFCTTRRAVKNLPGMKAPTTSSSSSSSGVAGSGSSSGSAESASSDASATPPHHPHVVHSHGVLGSHYLPHSSLPDPEEEQEPLPVGSTKQQQQQRPEALAAIGLSSSSSSSPAAAAAAAGERGGGGGGGAAAAAAAGTGKEEAGWSGAANVLAAVLTAAATAVVEAPLELFRHNSQAGQFQGNFVHEMWRVMRHQGPGALYWGFVPYCLESWPYDVTELLVVGGLKDARPGLAARSSQLGHAVASMPPHVYDLAVGAVAGTAAVLVSMPFDCIKTYMQTHGQEMAGTGALGSAGAFWRTGLGMVAKRGPGALYVGLTPRLLHQVPGAMVCWWAIEGCHRHLQRYNASTATAAAAAATASGPRGHDGGVV